MKRYFYAEKCRKKGTWNRTFEYQTYRGKYHGAVDWSVDGKVFILSVMMKDERRTENEY